MRYIHGVISTALVDPNAPELRAPPTILLDARSGPDARARYLAEHLRGARFVDLESDLSAPDDPARGGRHPLPPIARWAETLGRLGIGPDDDVEKRRQDILNAVGRVNDGSGVILLTDMFGGTPSNLAISVMEAGSVEVIAGANLPMLIKLASVRGEKPLAEAIADAQDAGRKYINVASQVLNGK